MRGSGVRIPLAAPLTSLKFSVFSPQRGGRGLPAFCAGEHLVRGRDRGCRRDGKRRLPRRRPPPPSAEPVCYAIHIAIAVTRGRFRHGVGLDLAEHAGRGPPSHEHRALSRGPILRGTRRDVSRWIPGHGAAAICAAGDRLPTGDGVPRRATERRRYLRGTRHAAGLDGFAGGALAWRRPAPSARAARHAACGGCASPA